MWFGEKLRCRLRATGWLFGLDLKQVHGICVPSVPFRTALAPTADSASVKSASHFSDLFINFKCQWRRGQTFLPRGRAILILFAVAKGGIEALAASTLTCCSLVALLAGGPAASEYQGPDYAKLKALLSPGQDAASCYARRYSAEHLKQHPKQKVTEMMLFLRYVTLGEDDAILISTDNGDASKQYFRYDFTLAAKVRDTARSMQRLRLRGEANGRGSQPK